MTSRRKPLLESTKKVLAFFKAPHTRKEAIDTHCYMLNQDTIKSTMTRLIGKGLIEVATGVRAERGNLYRITNAGKLALKEDVTLMVKSDAQVNVYSKAGAANTFASSYDRSLMHRPDYVPPKDECPRARALDYKTIPSKGIR